MNEKPVFACRQALRSVSPGFYQCDGGRWRLHSSNRGLELSHAGLILDRLLPGHDDESAGKRVTLECARHVSSDASALYAAAFRRRDSECSRNGMVSFLFEVAPGTRLVIGLGADSPLETGLRLNHTYGVPLLPGSALKGLAAHYCDAVVAEQSEDRELRRVVAYTKKGKHRQRTGKVYELLFGNTDDAGFIVFHDAWIHPRSLSRDGEGLLLDVLTPHHGDYYAEKRYDCPEKPHLHGQLVPPTDFDNPVPIQFLSIRGRFHCALSWNDSSGAVSQEDKQERETWLRFAQSLLEGALADRGIGAKTSSGYGRMIPVAQKRPPNTVVKVLFLGESSEVKKAFRVQEEGRPEGILRIGKKPSPLPSVREVIEVPIHRDDHRRPEYKWPK